jgi:methyl-accepting chemotaxis protein
LLFIAVLGWYASQRLTTSDATSFVLVVIACAIVVLLGVLTINYFIQRQIKDRLLGLVDVCREFAGGNRAVRAPVGGEDEFAMLSMSLNTLLDNQGTAQNGISLGATSGDASALQAQIEKLLQEVSAVGDGDLRVQAEVTPDTLGVLADSFNYMIEELAKVVGRVQATAVQVTNATRRILDNSAELAQASETQVAQISHTTEAVEALAIFIQNVARNAQLSAEAAQEAINNASSGQQAVRQTIEGMMLIRENVQETAKKIKRLGERSNEIGEIVRIIEDIADQTNLLALNAAIQSAMAGEHGRGFAVVADEIRLLAERSTESTKRIATLVKSIQGDTYEAVVAMEDSTQEVVRGSQLADEAGRSLNSIYGAVERQAQMIESIAHAANEQAAVSEAVAVAMGQISEITRRTNTGTQEAAASVSYLSELSEQLRASVSTFRLPDRGNEMMDMFPGMTSLAALPEGNADLVGVGAGMDNDWGQNFSMNFPPISDSRNSGSVAALTSRSGQFPFDNQQDFPSQPGFAAQQQFTSQPNFNGQPSFPSQPGFGTQQQFTSQPIFGTQQPSFPSQPGFGTQQQFTSQPNFSGQQSFTSQPGFGTQQPFSGELTFGEFSDFESQQGFNDQQQQFGTGTGNGGQIQSFYTAPGQASYSQPQQPGQTGQAPNSRQRRLGGPQQNQSSYDHEQWNFPQNGQ